MRTPHVIRKALSMKRTYYALLLVTCLCLNSAPASSQTLRPESEMRASPRDIREIFLTLPFPAKPEKDSLAEYYAGFIDTYEKRLKILQKPFTHYADYPNVFDLSHAYLRLNLWDERGQYIFLTHFTKSNNERVVVLQLVSEYGVEKDPHTEDYFYTLAADGGYTQEPDERYLPPITFEDFWGNQTLPSFVARSKFSYFHLYNIVWPQNGTVATVRSYSPYHTSEPITAEQRKIKAIYDRRSYLEMKLIWDKESGRFVKGEKIRQVEPR